MLTQDYVQELLDYNPYTGNLIWKKILSPRRQVGDIAGCDKHRTGYSQVQINGKQYAIHRIVWLWVYGDWPKQQIDHINGIRSDNRLVNLREASPKENQQNRGINKNNTSGYRNVSWDKYAKKWRAQFYREGKLYILGLYDSPEEANVVYLKEKAKYHEFQPTIRS